MVCLQVTVLPKPAKTTLILFKKFTIASNVAAFIYTL